MISAKNTISIILLSIITLSLISVFYYLYRQTSYTIISEIEINDQSISDAIDIKNNEITKVIVDYKIPILLYHYVEYNENEADFLRDQLNIEPHIFEDQITTLIDEDYEFLFPSEVADLISNHKSTKGQKYIIISFDDGFRDYYTDVFPILKKHNVKSVIYIVPNFLNQENYMYDSEIRELLKSGLVEVGSHTMSHYNLSNLSQEQLNYEIDISKQYIRDRFLVEAKSFAYPYGDYNDLAIETVKKAGYTNAVTTESGNSYNISTIYKIPRIRPGYLSGDALIKLIE